MSDKYTNTTAATAAKTLIVHSPLVLLNYAQCTVPPVYSRDCLPVDRVVFEDASHWPIHAESTGGAHRHGPAVHAIRVVKTAIRKRSGNLVRENTSGEVLQLYTAIFRSNLVFRMRSRDEFLLSRKQNDGVIGSHVDKADG